MVGGDDKSRVEFFNAQNLSRETNFIPRRLAFCEEHIDNLLAAVVAEKLPLCLLVIFNTVTLDHINEVVRRVAREGGFCEMRILRNEIIRPAMDIGKITATAARDTNFLAGLGRVIEDKNGLASRASDGPAHEARSACADNDDVVVCGHGGGFSGICVGVELGYRSRDASKNTL